MLLAPALPFACPPLPPPAEPALHPNFAERLFRALGHHSAQEVLRWPAAQPGATPHSVSGATLLARVQAWQQALEATGPLPLGAPVLLAHPGSPELVAALLAVLGLGGVPVLPPAGAGPRTLYHLLKVERIGLAVVAPGVQRRLGWLGRLVGCRCVAAPAVADDDEWAAPRPSTGAMPVLREVRLEQPALISHSSGSTSGQPVAVRRSHRVLQAQHEALRIQFPPWPGQRDFPLFPNVILHNLAVGALSIVPDLPGGKLAQFDPARVVTQLVAERIETLTGNVFYFEQLLAHLGQQPATFPRVRALGVGGSPVPEPLLVALRRCFPQAVCHVIYGASEAEPIAVRTVAGPALDPRLGYCVGQPHAGLTIRLHEPRPMWQPAPIPTLGDPAGPPRYQAGEVLVRGPHVAAAPGAWLPTGDFGYFDAAGQLWLTGRRGAATLVRGVGHYQLEHCLRQLPGVVQVAALPRPDGSVFDVLVAGSITAAAVQAASAAAFGPGLVGQVTHRTKLPVDGRHFSKIRYDLLR